MKETVTIGDAIDLLNGALEADREAITALVGARVKCNEQLGEHPTIQVGHDLTVGLLGVINGLFGTFDDGPRKGWGAIAAWLEGGVITHFSRVENQEPTE